MKKTKNILARLILLSLLSAFSVFADDSQNDNKLNYVLVMQGNTSIFTVEKVNITKTEDVLTVIINGGNKVIFKKKNTLYQGEYSSQNGEYTISCKKENSILKGSFIFEPSKKGKQYFYTKDKGIFILEKFSKEEFKKWKVLSDKQLQGINNRDPINKLAKHSPLIRAKIAKYQEMTKNDNIQIKFYGKIINQFGTPVKHAEVIGVVDYMPLIMWTKNKKIYKIKTNKNGEFNIDSNGTSVYIRKIYCYGYRSSFSGEKSFNYKAYRNPFVADPKKPVVFVMSKITDKATFLIKEDNFKIDIKQNSEKLYSFIDLEEEWENAGRNREYMKDFLPKHYDFKVHAVFDKKKSDWVVTFTASGRNGGFTLCDEFLSEAPEKGYKKEFSFTQHVLTEKEEDILSETEDNKVRKYIELREFVLKNKYLYIKSREPAVYTRMKFKYTSIDKERFNIFTSTATNPYGERNLEFYDGLPLDISDECSNVDEYFFKGQLPPKPDIKKMMTEFKKNHKRVKNKYYGDYEWIKK